MDTTPLDTPDLLDIAPASGATTGPVGPFIEFTLGMPAPTSAQNDVA